VSTVKHRIKEVDVDRVEARRRLEHGTRFRFVDDKVVLRSTTMLEAYQEPREEPGSMLSRTEHGVVDETSMVMAA